MTIERMRTIILFVVLAWFLYLINSGIIRTEQSIAAATPAYFELAPRDPRSLIQGDYMVLWYALEDDLSAQLDMSSASGQEGQMVVTLDENGVARFERIHAGEELMAGELLVAYRVVNSWDIHVGVESFFFQEGLADQYADARYAQVRLTPSGIVHLIELVDSDFQPLVD